MIGAKREPLLEDEAAYMDMQWRRVALAQMSEKKRLKFLKAWAEEVALNPVQPITGARPSRGCIERANALLRSQIPLLLQPATVKRRPSA